MLLYELTRQGDIMRTSEGKIMFMLLAVVVATFLASCSKDDLEQSREPAVRPVKLLTIAGAGTEQSSRYPAVIYAAQLSRLSFQVGGLLEELPVRGGQEVARGDIIAKLDQRDFRNNVASAKAKFDIAEKDYQRAVRLEKEDAIARSVLEQRKSRRDIDKAQLNSAEKALADTVMRAPFSGVIAQVPAKRLLNVQAGETIVELMGTEAAEARFDVPASVIAQAPTREDRSAYVMLDAAPGKRIEATFKKASLVADATSQTYAITFGFKPPDDLIILPGMNATVELASVRRDAGAQTNRVAVPLAAMMSDGDANFVWVVDDETMTVSKRSVTIEEGIGESVIVTEGLTPGETIAGAGATYLAEGMIVRAWAD